MRKIFYVTLVLFSFSLAACTRESSKTSENKNTPENPQKNQEQVNTNTPSTEKKTPESGQNSSNESSGENNNGDFPKFTQKVYKKSYKGCDETKEDCTNFQVYYPEMSDGKYKDKVNSLVKDMALSCYSVEDTHYSDFDKLIAAFMKDYEDFRKDVPDAPAVWYLKDTTGAKYMTSDFICLENTSETYLGGAHGSYNVAYTNIDLRNGNVLKTKDIFKKGYEGLLNKVIEKKFREQMKLKPNESLTEGGLFDNRIGFNDNFALTKNGVEFLYNQYEIAPYAVGVIEIKLSYWDISAILTDDTIKLLNIKLND